MSLGDEFQVTLASNVTSNIRNKPSSFETTLAKPLELPGEWEVALIDLSYPHNWTNLEKTYTVAIITEPFSDTAESQTASTIENQSEILNLIKGGEYPNDGARVFDIPAGNYKVEDIVNIMTVQVNKIPTLKESKISYNENTHKVTFTQTKTYVIAVYSNNALLQLLGLSKQTKMYETEGKPSLECLKLEENKPLTSELTALIKRLTSMFVYSDIVELSLVGDSQSALLGYCPIHSNFGDQGYWCFNPPYYVRVRERCINSIKIELCTDTGELFPIEDGKVNCRLNFRRIGLIR